MTSCNNNNNNNKGTTTNPFADNYMGSTNPFSNDYQGDRPPPFNPEFIRSVERGKLPSSVGVSKGGNISNTNKSTTEQPPLTIDPDRIEHVTFDEEPFTNNGNDASHHHPLPFNPDFIHNVACSVPTPLVSSSRASSRKHSFATTTTQNTSSRSHTTTTTATGQTPSHSVPTPLVSSSMASSRNHSFATTTQNTSSRSHATTTATTGQTPSHYRRSSSSSVSSSAAASWKLVVSQLKQASISGARKVKQYEEDHELRIRTKRAALQSYRAVKTATRAAGQKAKELNGKAKELNDKHQVTVKTKQSLQRGASFVKKKCSPPSVRRRRRMNTCMLRG